MESVGGFTDDGTMELLTNIGAIVTGLLTVIVGGFALASILFDDLV